MTEITPPPSPAEKRKTYTSAPPYDEYKRILSGSLKATYQCSRCGRDALLTIGETFYCDEHYFERRLELNYDEKNPTPNDWRDQMVGELMARNPQWNRRDDETKTEYVNRMLAETNKRLTRLREKQAA